jgi:protease-4
VLNLIENISGFSPEEALRQGLVDGIRNVSNIADVLKESDKSPSKVSIVEYSQVDPASIGIEGEERVAVIYCVGTMTGGEDGSDPYFGRTMGANRVIRDINRAANSKSIKAIILRINSPGGSSLAADKIWHALNQAAKEKPIVASISDIGASGGYYIAIPADTIIAQNLSLVGSIGVYAGKFSLAGLYDKIELKNEVIKRGKNAGLFSLSAKFTDSERKIIKNMINQFYRNFVSKVSQARNKPYDEIDKVARGRVWNGLDLVKSDLIDLIGGLDEAIVAAKDLADINPSTTVRLIYFPRSRSLINQYLGGFIRLRKTLENPVLQMEEYLKKFNMKPLVLMPFSID